MQGSKTCRFLLLLFACSWLLGCGASTATPTPVALNSCRGTGRGDATCHPAGHPTNCHCHYPYPTCALCRIQSSGQRRRHHRCHPSTLLARCVLAGFAMQTALNIAVTDINEQGGVLGRTDSPCHLRFGWHTRTQRPICRTSYSCSTVQLVLSDSITTAKPWPLPMLPIAMASP